MCDLLSFRCFELLVVRRRLRVCGKKKRMVNSTRGRGRRSVTTTMIMMMVMERRIEHEHEKHDDDGDDDDSTGQGMGRDMGRGMEAPVCQVQPVVGVEIILVARFFWQSSQYSSSRLISHLTSTHAWMQHRSNWGISAGPRAPGRESIGMAPVGARPSR